ncbi:MAG: DUF6448 family protein [Candidatus Microthrix subdominans]
MRILKTSFVVTAVLGAILAARPVLAHCDTADGPVVAAAKVALEKGDITPVLKWVKPAAESEIRAAFTRALAVRQKGPDAQALADQFFFENLVRIHRAGEGAPYTGILTADGLPVGLQIIAGRHRDAVPLRLARILEQARPWPRHAPVRGL